MSQEKQQHFPQSLKSKDNEMNWMQNESVASLQKKFRVHFDFARQNFWTVLMDCCFEGNSGVFIWARGSIFFKHTVTSKMTPTKCSTIICYYLFRGLIDQQKKYIFCNTSDLKIFVVTTWFWNVNTKAMLFVKSYSSSAKTP